MGCIRAFMGEEGVRGGGGGGGPCLFHDPSLKIHLTTWIAIPGECERRTVSYPTCVTCTVSLL